MSLNPESEAGRDDLLTGLNPEQKRAVTLPGGPLLILAGAGSGKTRVITHRIAWLIQEQHVHPSEILAITFTNKAANEMKERTAALIGPAASRMWIGTFHTMMLRILRQVPELVGLRPNFTILDTDDQKRALQNVMKELGIDDPTLTMRELTSRISTAKNDLVSVAQFKKEASQAPYLMTVARIYEAYVDYCLRLNAVDFDDILIHAVTVLSEHEDVRLRFAERFRHILVDEYQDTNRAQYEIVRRLASVHRNLAVVGDDDQSIYRFRGADIRNILDFEEDYRDATVIRLEQNYRSTSTILEASNAVIGKNEKRKKKKLWTAGLKGDPVHFYLAEDHWAEARYVAFEIARRLHKDPETDIAILCRVTALTRNFETALNENGVAFRMFGGQRFYERREIRDLVGYLRLLTSPADDLALNRIINVPRRGIGQATIDTVGALALQNGLSLYEVVKQAERFDELSRAKNALSLFSALIESLSAKLSDGHMSLKDFVEAVMEESGLRASLEEEAVRDFSARTRLENLKELLSDALEFERRYLAGETDEDETEAPAERPDSLRDILLAYLERAALYSDQDKTDEKAQVTIMTIHSAKGLEFSDVYVVGMEEQIFPNAQAHGIEEEIAEERRLCYVAFTRAKCRLTVTAARSRMLYGRTAYNDTSRFLADIPNELILETGGSRKPVAARSAAPRSSSPLDVSWRKDSAVGGTKKKETGTGGLDPAAITVGDQVSHANFGTGEIVAITPAGDEAILRINFDGRERRFLASSKELSKAP